MDKNDLKGKKVLVVGLGKSGRAAADALLKAGAEVSVTDPKTKEELGYEDIPGIKAYLGGYPKEPEVDLIVVSPGVPLNNPLFKDRKVIGELELAYILGNGTFIAITGTNGKTTTTALTGSIFAMAHEHTYVVGNIGTPVVSKSMDAEKDAWLVTECSSFQLETIDCFRPKVSAVLNITPDHLNRHGTMAEYIRCKFRICENQTENDILVVNYDDETVMAAVKDLRCKVIGFSRKVRLTGGAYLEDGNVTVDGKTVCGVKDIRIIGDHNIENVLAAAAICYYAGIDIATIGEGIRAFNGVEHRLEFVTCIDGVSYYNDSKGTNTDATITAIRALKENIVLLAGGDSKGQDFTSLAEALRPAVRHVILYGRDRKDILKAMEAAGYGSYTEVKDLPEAVDAAYRIAKTGDSVLLSPACASWDSYKNFEIRGKHFKELVEKLK